MMRVRGKDRESVVCGDLEDLAKTAARFKTLNPHFFEPGEKYERVTAVLTNTY